jgi:hypothetical protein
MPENDVVFITCLMSYEDGMWYSCICTMYDFIMDIIHFVQSNRTRADNKSGKIKYFNIEIHSINICIYDTQPMVSGCQYATCMMYIIFFIHTFLKNYNTLHYHSSAMRSKAPHIWNWRV